jgi:hypothetical protein
MSRELTITLPDELAADAERLGVLRPEDLETVIRAEVRRRAADRLGEAMQRLAAVDEPPLSMEEIQAEVDAVRAERRAKRARGA